MTKLSTTFGSVALLAILAVLGVVESVSAVPENCDQKCRERQNHKACGINLCYYWVQKSCYYCVENSQASGGGVIVGGKGACFKEGDSWDSACLQGGTNTRYEYADCLTRCECVTGREFVEAPAETISSGTTFNTSLYTCVR